MPTLAYTPFLDPLPLHDHWFWTLIPLLILTAAAYKAIRIPNLKAWPAQVAIMTLQLVLLMAFLAAAIHILVEFILPFLTT